MIRGMMDYTLLGQTYSITSVEHGDIILLWPKVRVCNNSDLIEQ